MSPFLSLADRAQTKTITVRADSKMPEEMFYHGMAQSVGGAFGAIGGAVGASMAGGGTKVPGTFIV